MTFEDRKTGESVQVPAAARRSRGRHRAEVRAPPLSDGAKASRNLDSRDLGYTVITTRAPTDAELAAARGAVSEITDSGSTLAGNPYESGTAIPLLIILARRALWRSRRPLLQQGWLAPTRARTSPRWRRSGHRRGRADGSRPPKPPSFRCWGRAWGVWGAPHRGRGHRRHDGQLREFFYGTLPTPTLPVAIPWSALGVLVMVVPAVAVTLAFIFSRSTLPMVRRVD